ncbi:MAG: 30S ribosomal protein S17 [Candidatus Heimdallarchaeota archaeon]|nr:30S ribosomal protein S17 [Candidatus Heimdallarchaeota archaeon]
MSARNIGVEVKAPSKTCEDSECPFHGTLPVHGRIIEGVVSRASMQKTVVVRRDYLYLVKKYDRYEKRSGKVSARLPNCIDVKRGDLVRVMETRPLSRNVSFVVIEKLEAKH